MNPTRNNQTPPVLQLAEMIRAGRTPADIEAKAEALGIPPEMVKRVREEVAAHGRPMFRAVAPQHAAHPIK